MVWLKTNWKQGAIIMASVGCGVLLHYRPELRDEIIMVGGLLAGVGIHLKAVAYGKKDGAS